MGVNLSLVLEDTEKLHVVGGAEGLADEEGVMGLTSIGDGVGDVVSLIALIVGAEEGDELVAVQVEHEVALPTE